eukprot:403335390
MKNQSQTLETNKLQQSQYSTRSTMSGSSSGLYSRQGILQRKQKSNSTVPDKNFSLQDKDFQKTQTQIDSKAQKLMKIHEYRRIAFFGSPLEKKAVQQVPPPFICFSTLQAQKCLQEYKNDCDNLLKIKEQKQRDFERRDKLQTQQAQKDFERGASDVRKKEIERREQMKRVAEDNLMMAQNKKRQEMIQQVQDNIREQKAIADSKIKYSAMIR